MFRTSSVFRSMLVPSLLLMKHKRVEFTNTIVSLHGEEVRVDRTQFVGFDLENMVPTLPQLRVSNEPEKIEESTPDPRMEEHEVQIVSPSEEQARNTDLNAYEKYRGVLFTSVLGEVKIMSYFPTQGRTISWNQLATLLLLLTEAELNGKASVLVQTFLETLSRIGITSANWQSSVSKYFKAQQGPSGHEILCSQAASVDRASFFDALVEHIDKCVSNFDKTLEKCGEKSYTMTTSNLQLVHTVTMIAFSGGKGVKIETIYEALRNKNINIANYVAALETITLRPLFFYNREEKTVSIYQSKSLFNVLEKHKALLKRCIGKAEQSPKKAKSTLDVSARVSPSSVEMPTASSKEIVPSGVRRVLAGYGAIIGSPGGDYNVFIHYPKSIFREDIDKRRIIMFFCLAGLREYGVNEASYGCLYRMLKDNRMPSINVPRDVMGRTGLFLHDAGKKTFSSTNSDNSKELLRSLISYQVRKEDITLKLAELLPIIKPMVTGNTKGYIERAEITGKCAEKGVRVMLSRDIPPLFGFCFGDKFYFFAPAFEAAFKIVKSER